MPWCPFGTVPGAWTTCTHGLCSFSQACVPAECSAWAGLDTTTDRTLQSATTPHNEEGTYFMYRWCTYGVASLKLSCCLVLAKALMRANLGILKRNITGRTKWKPSLVLVLVHKDHICASLATVHTGCMCSGPSCVTVAQGLCSHLDGSVCFEQLNEFCTANYVLYHTTLSSPNLLMYCCYVDRPWYCGHRAGNNCEPQYLPWARICCIKNVPAFTSS